MMNLKQSQCGQQVRRPGICPRVYAGELVDSVETKINGIGMNAQALRGLLYVEIAIGESVYRAIQCAPLAIPRQAQLARPFGNQANRGAIGAPDQKLNA
jgi:hypothetical protein